MSGATTMPGATAKRSPDTLGVVDERTRPGIY